MSSALDVLDAARSQLGTVEGKNNDILYGKWYGLNNNPYCAMFVSWCFNEANLSNLIAAQSKKGFASCAAGLGWFQKKKQVVDKYKGKPGDIVFFSFAGNGSADHVGIIEGVSRDGITTIEGNTSPDHMTNASQRNGGGVYRRHRPYLNVIAIVRPAYPTASKPTSSLSQNKTVAGVVAATTALGGGGAAVVNSNSTPTKPSTSVSAPAFPGYSAFAVGKKSKAILAVEQALVKAGLLPSADGLYTNNTRKAIAKYQKSVNLGTDGIIGPKTYASLIKKLK